MPYLSWISDSSLIKACKRLTASFDQGRLQAASKLDRNVIDPFAASFSMMLFNMSPQQWKDMEIHRQIDKSLSNAIGAFHQDILASIPGWQDLCNKNQVDLVNPQRKIIAELKNKHNTLNASGAVALYKKLSDLVNSKSSCFKGYVAYYVIIVPKTSKGIDDCFYPSDNALGERCKKDEKIRFIDGMRFYSLATGVSTALKDLFEVIPVVFEENLDRMNERKTVLPYVLQLFNKAYAECFD